jgi:hypothetical protein
MKWTNIQIPYGCVTCPFSSQLINGNDECPVYSCLLNFEGIFERIKDRKELLKEEGNK